MERSLGRAGTDPVLDLLAPLRAAYLRRSGSSDERHRPELSALRASGPPSEGPLAPCVVEAVVTVDPEGRIPWRFCFEELRNGTASIGIGDQDIIELSPGDQSSARHAPDHRGRLHLPQGVLRAVGLGPGDRVAVLRLPDGRGVGLVSVRKLGVRRESA